MKRVAECFREGADALRATSPSPELDARLLLSHVLGRALPWLIAHAEAELESHQLENYRQLIQRRSASEPVAYLIGCKEFYGRDFCVSPDVLIPRPETELLVEAVLKWAQQQARADFRVLDLGSGSGCLGISVAMELRERGKNVELTQVDSSEPALAVTHQNAERLGCSSRVLLSDWFNALGQEKFEIVLSNPPYVGTTEAGLSPETSFEPQQALFSGLDGLCDVERILSALSAHITAGGLFVCEIGMSQGGAVLDLAKNIFPGAHAQILKDWSGKDRSLFLEL